MKEKVENILEYKLKQYSLVVAWFDYEYVNCNDSDVIKEYEKQGTELNAQIKLLRHILDEN